MGIVALSTVSSTKGDTFSKFELFRDKFSLSISSTAEFSAVITVQRRFGVNGKIRDVNTHTTDAEIWGVEPQDNVFYRAGVKSGDYTSGIAHIRLSQ